MGKRKGKGRGGEERRGEGRRGKGKGGEGKGHEPPHYLEEVYAYDSSSMCSDWISARKTEERWEQIS